MGFSDRDRATLIEIVRQVAREEIIPRFRALDPDTIEAKSAPDDLVTIADKRAEEKMTEAFLKAFPGTAVIGEEAISEDRSLLNAIEDAERCIIIDPIDGTWNYAKGLATYGVIVAVVENGETVFGLLYDPSYDDWIAACKGEGAYFGGAARSDVPLKLDQSQVSLDDMVGFVGMYLYPRAEQEHIAAKLPGFRRTMSLRCSCHEYRQLALGSVEFCLNGWLNPWDHAAGVLIHEEAGGFVRLLDGSRYRPGLLEGRLLVARSEEIWSDVKEAFGALAP